MAKPGIPDASEQPVSEAELAKGADSRFFPEEVGRFRETVPRFHSEHHAVFHVEHHHTGESMGYIPETCANPHTTWMSSRQQCPVEYPLDVLSDP